MKNELMSIINEAMKHGFDSYGNFRTEDDDTQQEILTCIKGQFSGEVIEISYDYNTGEIKSISQYSQFKTVVPKYIVKQQEV